MNTYIVHYKDKTFSNSWIQFCLKAECIYEVSKWVIETFGKPYCVTLTSDEDWQVINIGKTFFDEIDCNSGLRRRVWRKSGRKEMLLT